MFAEDSDHEPDDVRWRGARAQRPARSAVAVPDLCRAQLRARQQPPLPRQSGARPDRAVGRLRPADPDRLRQRPPARRRRGRPGRRAGRRAARHADAVRGHPARADEHLDDDQRDRALAAGALRRRRGASGGGPRQARRHGAERPDQGVPVARHLHLPAAALAQAHRRRDRVHLPRDAGLEPGQRLLLPPAGGGCDAGAGARLRARRRDADPRHGQGRRPGAGRGPAAGGRPHQLLRQRRPALRHRDVQAARLQRACGTRSRARATASRTRRCAASATASRSTRSA